MDWKELPDDYLSVGEIAKKAATDIVRFTAESKNEEDIASFMIGRIWRAIIEGRSRKWK